MATPDDLAHGETRQDTGARIMPGRPTSATARRWKRRWRRASRSWARLDIVIANAGIAPMMGENAWQDVIDVNLTGVYHTVDVAMRPLIKQGDGGAVVLTSSVAGLVGIGAPIAGSLGYTAAKHGIVGLMRAYANFLAPYSIRVNSGSPGRRGHPDDRQRLHPLLARRDGPATLTRPRYVQCAAGRVLQSQDIANAVRWLVSDAARYVTGVALPVDAGFVNKR